MNSMYVNLIAIAALIFSTSCNHNSHEHGDNQDHDHSKKEAETGKAETTEHQEHGTLELDNGNKWPANVETTAGIAEMKYLLVEFNDKPEQFSVLRGELDVIFTSILKQCTMTGEAHNQLHNYLLPLRDMFPSLESDDEMMARNAFNKIDSHLNMYSDYFE
ncbi:MAG: hypothetical protein RIE58_04980 [Vicingaceae bacterium]